MSQKLVRNGILDAEVGLARQMSESAATKMPTNQEKLQSCSKPHDFQLPIRGISGFPVKWTCSKCAGFVTDEARRWYVLGLTHGRRESDPTYPDLPADFGLSTLHDVRVQDTQTSQPDKRVFLL